MSKILESLFGPPKKSPEEQAKEWRRELNAEQRKIDAQVRKIQREEQKAVVSAKQAAKMGDNVAVRMLAKEILGARKSVKRLITAKTQMNSVGMQLQQQASMLKLAGTMQKSTEIMAQMNTLCKIPELQAVVMNMSREMTKAGLIEEMMDDTMESALDGDISDSELDTEVGKVVEEVMQAKMQGARVGSSKIPEKQKEPVQAEEAAAEDEEDDELMARYAQLNQKT
jgi:charged multivesicular body protein 3